MKNSIITGLAVVVAAGSALAQTNVQSAEYYGVSASSISDNGKWMVCETDNQLSIKTINLETGESWTSIDADGSGANGFSIAFTRAVSNDGTVVGEAANIPSYRTPDGSWTELKGAKADRTGYVYATVGAITPDGSMIVGSLGKGDASMYDDGDIQLTYPCVWRMQDDGTYSEPEWLPYPEKDIFGRIPQYVNCIAVSQDGKTVGAMMRSGSGYFHFPIAYTLGADGAWEMTLLGMDVINPDGIVPYPFPGEYENDTPMPSYEMYMTGEELSAFYAFFDALLPELAAEGYSDEDIMIIEHAYALEFMNGPGKEEYEAEFDAWFDVYDAWQEAWSKYENSMVEIMETGYDFEFNNIFISPDGKNIYSTAKPQLSEDRVPVCMEVETGKTTAYPSDYNILISSIAEDHSILGRPYNLDTDMYSMAYIFPQGDNTPMSMLDYLRDTAEPAAVEWVEDHMYQSVVTSVTASGQEVFGDEWVFGKPLCTPDMSLIAFANSTLYWETPPTRDGYLTFLVNTGVDLSGVEAVEITEPDSDDGTAVYYNMQGLRVDNPGHGIYVKIAGGKAVKVLK